MALAVFNDLNWKDDDPSSTFVYPFIVTESYYYDSELERRGVTNIDVQVDVNLLKSSNGAARTDVVFILANGDRRYGHFTLVRVKKEEKYIAVCDPYNGCLTDRLLQSCVSFIEKVYGEESPRVVEEKLRNITPGFWKVVKETPNNQDNPSDKTACGPLCLERIIQWMSTRYNNVKRYYNFDPSSPSAQYRCIRRRCIRYMANALIEHDGTVVDRYDLAWRGTDNRPGLRDITIAMYSKSATHFTCYFSNPRDVFLHGTCFCSEESTKRPLSFRHCVVILPFTCTAF